jgi:hypothetical protein
MVPSSSISDAKQQGVTKAANLSFNLDEQFEDKKSEAANFIAYVYANAIV